MGGCDVITSGERMTEAVTLGTLQLSLLKADRNKAFSVS